MIWIICIVLSFIAAQLYLIHCLRKLDQHLSKREKPTSRFTYEDSDRYLDEDVLQ